MVAVVVAVAPGDAIVLDVDGVAALEETAAGHDVVVEMNDELVGIPTPPPPPHDWKFLNQPSNDAPQTPVAAVANVVVAFVIVEAFVVVVDEAFVVVVVVEFVVVVDDEFVAAVVVEDDDFGKPVATTHALDLPGTGESHGSADSGRHRWWSTTPAVMMMIVVVAVVVVVVAAVVERHDTTVATKKSRHGTRFVAVVVEAFHSSPSSLRN